MGAEASIKGTTQGEMPNALREKTTAGNYFYKHGTQFQASASHYATPQKQIVELA